MIYIQWTLSKADCSPWYGVCMLSPVWLFATPWTVAHHAPPSMDFSRQEYWNGLPFSTVGESSHPRIKFVSPALAREFFTTEPPNVGRPHPFSWRLEQNKRLTSSKQEEILHLKLQYCLFSFLQPSSSWTWTVNWLSQFSKTASPEFWLVSLHYCKSPFLKTYSFSLFLSKSYWVCFPGEQ